MEPRLSSAQTSFPTEHMDRLKPIDFKKLYSGITLQETATSRLKELCGGRSPDTGLECAASEYATGRLSEMVVGAETDTSEIVNA
ncbi:hypothetical protein RJ55_07255 [Drechmeria coniospora]|nr:hypothetical protein RJ55_07255 [Drechmeria coniospora]